MPRTLPCTQAPLNLRRVALNGEWDPFIDHNIHQETCQLPGQTSRCPSPPRGVAQGRARLVTLISKRRSPKNTL